MTSFCSEAVANQYSSRYDDDEEEEVEVFPKFIPASVKKIIVDDNDGKTWEVKELAKETFVALDSLSFADNDSIFALFFVQCVVCRMNIRVNFHGKLVPSWK